MWKALNITDRWKTIATDLGTFAAGLAATWFLGWSTRDLLWGLWICSLVSGFVFFVGSGVKKLKGQQTGDVVIGSIGLVFGLAFFALHFGAFHYIQGAMLDLLIPLEPDPGRVYIGNLTWKGARSFSIFNTIFIALTNYWTLIAIAIVHGFLSGIPDMQDRNESFRPYIFVLKMHFLMFALAALYAIGLESFPVYVLVLLFFFTPASLKLLFGSGKESAPEGV
jgi:hypothetical protein